MVLSQYGEGRCINCGYLGKRDTHASVSTSYEATSVERLLGELTKFMGMPIDYSPYERESIATRPWCFLNKAQFYQELADIGAKEHDIINVKDIISKDRKCPYWCVYQEGLNPKEHFEEFKMIELERERRAFEEMLDTRNKEFLSGLEIERQKWEKESSKWPNRLIWAAIIIAVAEVISNIPAIWRFLGLD